MKRLIDHITYFDRISNWVFQQVFLFFNGKPIPTDREIEQVLSSGNHAVPIAHVEWDLNQDYVDIYQHDLAVIYKWLTPARVITFLDKMKRYFLFFLYIDEELIENGEENPINRRIIRFNIESKILFYIPQKITTAKIYYRWFSHKILKLANPNKKIAKRFTTIIIRAILYIKNNIIFRIGNFRRTIRGPGNSKLIFGRLYHKRF